MRYYFVAIIYVVLVMAFGFYLFKVIKSGVICDESDAISPNDKFDIKRDKLGFFLALLFGIIAFVALLIPIVMTVLDFFNFAF